MQPIPISGGSKFEILIKRKNLAMIIRKVTMRMTIGKMTKCHNFDKWTFLLFLNYLGKEKSYQRYAGVKTTAFFRAF